MAVLVLGLVAPVLVAPVLVAPVLAVHLLAVHLLAVHLLADHLLADHLLAVQALADQVPLVVLAQVAQALADQAQVGQEAQVAMALRAPVALQDHRLRPVWVVDPAVPDPALVAQAGRVALMVRLGRVAPQERRLLRA